MGLLTFPHHFGRALNFLFFNTGSKNAEIGAGPFAIALLDFDSESHTMLKKLKRYW